MPEYVEVQLMAAILRIGLVGRKLSDAKRHYTAEKRFPSKNTMEGLRGKRVEYVYATGKTIVIVLAKDRRKKDVHPCQVFQPVQMGFITMVVDELLDKSPLYRGKEWQAGHEAPAAQATSANVGFVIKDKNGTPTTNQPTNVNWGCPPKFHPVTALEHQLDGLLNKGAHRSPIHRT